MQRCAWQLAGHDRGSFQRGIVSSAALGRSLWGLSHCVCGPSRQKPGRGEASHWPAMRRWILSADPEAGLEMLVQARPPLAPAAVLPILSAQVGAPGPPRRRCLCERGARVHPFIGKD
jgi:hypothetical protein